MASNKLKLLCIVGPTSSGKTSLSLKLAKKYNGEIISADSRQVYKDMNVGTNKISGYKKSGIDYLIPEFKEPVQAVEYQGIVHYMIDLITPAQDQEFSLYQFQQASKRLITDINSRDKLPILAGGTGLYINSIVDNLIIPNVPKDSKLRAELEKMEANELFKLFQTLNTSGRQTIDQNNRRRLIRAIEILKHSDKQKSVLRSKGPGIYDLLIIGLELPRPELYERINQWVDLIYGKNPDNSPLLKECKELIAKYEYTNNAVLNGLVYKQAIAYLTKQPSQREKGKKMSFEEAKELSKQVTRNYAKRQLTWFRKDKRIKWIKADSPLNNAIALIEDWRNNQVNSDPFVIRHS
jgi:tRNA dimethylallyltransferase